MRQKQQRISAWPKQAGVVRQPCGKVLIMPKQTYQPKKRQRSREHGFMKRMATTAGRKVLKNRRAKGRARLTH